jgi:hypothetical protein
MLITQGSCLAFVPPADYDAPMTIRRRRLWLVALAGLVLAGGVGLLALQRWAASATWVAVANRITNGMTKEAVYAILGPPDIVTGKPDSVECWEVVDGGIFVTFDRSGEVQGTMVIQDKDWSVTVIKNVRKKIGF